MCCKAAAVKSVWLIVPSRLRATTMTSQPSLAIKSRTVNPPPSGTITPPIPSMSRHSQRPAMCRIGSNTSGKRIRAPEFLGGDQRGKRLGKMERRDLLGRQLAVLNPVEEFRVGSAARAEWLHRERLATAPPQVVEEQARQEGLADACISARDENDARHACLVHGRELTTDQPEWTRVNWNPLQELRQRCRAARPPSRVSRRATTRSSSLR